MSSRIKPAVLKIIADKSNKFLADFSGTSCKWYIISPDGTGGCTAAYGSFLRGPGTVKLYPAKSPWEIEKNKSGYDSLTFDEFIQHAINYGMIASVSDLPKSSSEIKAAKKIAEKRDSDAVELKKNNVVFDTSKADEARKRMMARMSG